MYADVLEQMEKAKPESILKLRLSITFKRLALLEDKMHNQEQSLAYMDEARSWCKSALGRECSESEMKRMTDEFDERQSIYEP